MQPTKLWRDQPEVRYAEVSAGRLAYIEAGTGPTAVFIHGYGDHFFTWRQQIPALARGRRVLALDLPGHGYSDKPRRDYTPQLYVESLVEFLDTLRIDTAALVGNSMGAAVSVGVATRHPERVESLALLGPTTSAALPTGRLYDIVFELTRWPSLLEWTLRLPLRAASRLSLREAVEDPSLVTDEIVAHYHSLMRQPGFAHAYASTAVHWKDWVEFRPRFEELRPPVLLLWGERDRIHPIRQAGLVRTLVPGARFVPLPCGHLPQWELPAQVNAELEAHIR